MKYNIKLINGEMIENAQRGWVESLMENWGWRIFKVNGLKRHIPKHSILYIDEVVIKK